MKEKRFTLFWKKLLIMDLGLIVILVRIFGMILGYLTKKSSNDSIFPQNTENGYPFFDSINCDISNIIQILENDILNSTEINNTYKLNYESIVNSFTSNYCAFCDKINICNENKKCFDELEKKKINGDLNFSDLYNINNDGKMKISNIIKLIQDKNEFYLNDNNKNKVEIESYYKLFSGYNSYLYIKLYNQENKNNFDALKEITNYEEKVNNLFYTYSILLKAYTALFPNKVLSSKTESINYINECLRENDDQFTNKNSLLIKSEKNKEILNNIMTNDLLKIINCIPDFETRFSYSLDINAIKTTIFSLLNENNNKIIVAKNDKKIFNFFLNEFSKAIKSIFIADLKIRQKANIFLKYQPYFIVIFICISVGVLIFINRYFIKNREHYNQGSKILEKYKRDRYNFMYNNKHHQYMAKLKEMEEKRKEEEKKKNENINANGINNNNLDDKDKCTKEEIEYIEKLAKEHKEGDFILAK